MSTRQKYLVIFFIGIIFVINSFADDIYWYKNVGDTDSEMNFIFGFYTQRYEWVKSDLTSFSYIPGTVINNEKSDTLVWKDYKVLLLMNDNTIFQNYTTVADTGLYRCEYEVSSGEKQFQNFCFERKFEPRDIKMIWLKLSDSNFIKLIKIGKYPEKKKEK